MARLSALVRRGIMYEAINLPPLVLFREVLRDGETFGIREEQTVAVLVPLHLVAGAHPAAALCRLGGLVRIEVTWTERPTE